MTIEQIVKKRDCFKEITWRHLSNCLKSFEDREYLSAAIWSAVFVESCLRIICVILVKKAKIEMNLILL